MVDSEYAVAFEGSIRWARDLFPQRCNGLTEVRGGSVRDGDVHLACPGVGGGDFAAQ